MANIDPPPTDSVPASPQSLVRRLFRWVPVALYVALAVALAANWSRGGLDRIATWYFAQFIFPILGGTLLLVVIGYALWRRGLSAPMIVTGVLSLLSLTPLLLLFQIVPIPYPASIEGTEPQATVRLPANGPLQVGWGGDTIETNYHAVTPDQRWAYDFAIEPFGSGSDRLEDYGCYGHPVVAPVAGPVVAAHDGEPEATPGVLSNNFAAPLGNHIVIEHQSAYLIIAHLKQGSVRVSEGERVAEGQVIAECGNSGNTTEPHIHIHYQRQNPADFPINFAEGLPLFFRDHDGDPMPLGGLREEDGRIIATGDIVRHIGD